MVGERKNIGWCEVEGLKLQGGFIIAHQGGKLRFDWRGLEVRTIVVQK